MKKYPYIQPVAETVVIRGQIIMQEDSQTHDADAKDYNFDDEGDEGASIWESDNEDTETLSPASASTH